MGSKCVLPFGVWGVDPLWWFMIQPQWVLLPVYLECDFLAYKGIWCAIMIIYWIVTRCGWLGGWWVLLPSHLWHGWHIGPPAPYLSRGPREGLEFGGRIRIQRFRVWIQGSEFGILFKKKIEFYLRSIVTKIKVWSIGNITYFFSDIMTNDLEKDPRVYVSRLYYSGGASVVLFAFRRDEFGGFMPMAGIIQRHKLKIKLWL